MICEECKKQGLKSRVTPGHGSSTAMFCAPFYDEDGKYHDHDSNTSSYSYSCSNGHRWTASSGPIPCWCGWPKSDSAS